MLGGQEAASHVNGHNPVPEVDIDILHRHRREGGVEGSVVHENVDSPAAVQRRADERLDGSLLTDVGRNIERVRA